MPENVRRQFRIAGFMLVLVGLASFRALTANSQVVHADADYEAAGYVTPAGMVPPTLYQGAVQPVGFFSGSPASSCDAYGGCDSYGYETYGCDSGCDSCSGGGSGGILGKLGGGCGCCSCLGGGGSGGLSNLRHFCIFCRGSGCEACQCFHPSQICGLIGALKPYSDAGICAQRWYDLSAEALFLTHDSGGPTGGATSLGVGGPIVLGLGDADNGGDTEAGLRLSGALIFGAGGNIEATWMGGHEWNSSAAVSDPNAGLFSFLTDFGNFPSPIPGGFDDTDRSLTQTVSNSSEFDSVELNYRRRTVGPYCRFQGSWLVGLRYIRYDDGFLYSALGQNNNTVNASLPRFFSSNDETENRLFGGQIGFDLWYHVMPGVSAGIGAKGGWLKNDINRSSVVTANSLNPLATPGTNTVLDGDETGTTMGEFDATLVYRLTHSWSFRTAYYAIAIDDVAFGGVDVPNIRNFIQSAPTQPRSVEVDSLVVQGFSVGAEYIW